MRYELLSAEYEYDVLAGAIYAREQEHFHYSFDHGNYVEMLKSIPEGGYRAEIQKRIDDTMMNMQRVELIYQALVVRIVDKDAYLAAVERLKAKNFGATLQNT